MAWFEDMSEWTYLGFSTPKLKAIGWLASDHPFTTGTVGRAVFTRLSYLLREPWTPWSFMGYYDCPFCRFTGGSNCNTEWEDDGGQRQSARIAGKSDRELIVPVDGFLFITPRNVAHYIDSHGYCPPQQFQEAVLHCPDVQSQAYKLAFLNNGGRELMQHVDAAWKR